MIHLFFLFILIAPIFAQINQNDSLETKTTLQSRVLWKFQFGTGLFFQNFEQRKYFSRGLDLSLNQENLDIQAQNNSLVSSSQLARTALYAPIDFTIPMDFSVYSEVPYLPQFGVAVGLWGFQHKENALILSPRGNREFFYKLHVLYPYAQVTWIIPTEILSLQEKSPLYFSTLFYSRAFLNTLENEQNIRIKNTQNDWIQGIGFSFAYDWLQFKNMRLGGSLYWQTLKTQTQQTWDVFSKDTLDKTTPLTWDNGGLGLNILISWGKAKQTPPSKNLIKKDSLLKMDSLAPKNLKLDTINSITPPKDSLHSPLKTL